MEEKKRKKNTSPVQQREQKEEQKAAAKIGRNPVSKHQIQLSMERRLTRDGTAETVSRDKILWRERGQGNIYFPCSADHVQGWQLYPVDPSYSSYLCDYTYIHMRPDSHTQ